MYVSTAGPTAFRGGLRSTAASCSTRSRIRKWHSAHPRPGNGSRSVGTRWRPCPACSSIAAIATPFARIGSRAGAPWGSLLGKCRSYSRAAAGGIWASSPRAPIATSCARPAVRGRPRCWRQSQGAGCNRAAPGGGRAMSSIEAVHAGAASTAYCTSLVEALDLGRHVWDDLLARTGDVSPFMSWAWHRAWADGASAQDLSESHAVLVRGADHTVQAILPVAVRPTLFRRMRVNVLAWAIGDLGCPDHLDVLACHGADVDAILPAIESLPWDVIRLGNLVEGAPNAARLAAALARRGHRVRWRVGWSCPKIGRAHV